MQKVVFYTLGKGYPTHEGKPLYSWPFEVSFAPSRDGDVWYLAEGDARNGNGSFFTAQQVLEPQWRSHLEHTQTLWLIPFLEQVANGDSVAPEEIFDVYRELHGGDPPREERTLYWS